MKTFEKDSTRYIKKIAGSIKKKDKTIYHSKGDVFIFKIKMGR